jgi:FkbM family methyltransferase
MRLANDARLISSLGEDRLARVVLGATYLAMPIKRRVGWLDRLVVGVRVRMGQTVRTVRVSTAAEMLVLKEVLVERLYDVDMAEPSVVVDLGANVGVASLHFLGRWPDARIVAVEPDPTTVRKLRSNVASEPGVVVVQAAIVGSPASSVSFLADASSWGSRVAADEEHGTVRVPALTLDQLLAQAGVDHVDLLKIDIEGMEHEVLQPTAPALDRVAMIVGEVHPNGHADAEVELLEGLVRRGWRWVRPLEHQTFCLRAPGP